MPLGQNLFRLGMIVGNLGGGAPSATYLESVSTDESINGDGTSESPLGATPVSIGAHRALTPAESQVTPVGGAFTPDFTNHLTLPITLSESLTSINTPIGMSDGEIGEIIVTLNGFFVMEAPPIDGIPGSWVVSGPVYVRIFVERRGDLYFWTADSLGTEPSA
jgi:hypothetical protein